MRACFPGDSVPPVARCRGLDCRRGWVESLTTARWHYILLESGESELHDLAEDPRETTNLAAHPDHATMVRDLRAEVARAAPADFRP